MRAPRRGSTHPPRSRSASTVCANRVASLRVRNVRADGPGRGSVADVVPVAPSLGAALGHRRHDASENCRSDVGRSKCDEALSASARYPVIRMRASPRRTRGSRRAGRDSIGRCARRRDRRPDQLVDGRAADRERGRGFGDREENRIDVASCSVAGAGWAFVIVRSCHVTAMRRGDAKRDRALLDFDDNRVDAPPRSWWISGRVWIDGLYRVSAPRISTYCRTVSETPTTRPLLVVCTGPPGTGKSTIADHGRGAAWRHGARLGLGDGRVDVV